MERQAYQSGELACGEGAGHVGAKQACHSSTLLLARSAHSAVSGLGCNVSLTSLLETSIWSYMTSMLHA